jgi:hypothetical protein
VLKRGLLSIIDASIMMTPFEAVVQPELMAMASLPVAGFLAPPLKPEGPQCMAPVTVVPAPTSTCRCASAASSCRVVCSESTAQAAATGTVTGSSCHWSAAASARRRRTDSWTRTRASKCLLFTAATVTGRAARVSVAVLHISTSNSPFKFCQPECRHGGRRP